jgi:hypothetical protein
VQRLNCRGGAIHLPLVMQMEDGLTPEHRRCPARARVPALTIAALALLWATRANAVPSFASQTGMPCSQCHVIAFGPALTAYGRQFKLNGYTLGDAEHRMPLAVMLQGGFEHTSAAQPAAPASHFADNNNLSLDQASVFVATRISEHVGVFAQATYDGDARHFNWDNTDLRYSRAVSLFGTDEIIGISVNNNPTVQDLWNSTPAWGFPYITSGLVPSPAASPVIAGALAQLVVGVTGYTMIHDHLYLEAGGYRGLSDRWLDNVGLYPSQSPHVNGVAPYYRVAYQLSAGSHYFSAGTFGLDVKLQPDPTSPATNRYTDVGFDAQYQFANEGPHAVQVNFANIHERQNLAASFAAGNATNPKDSLNQLRLDAGYTYSQTWGGTLGLFDLTGSGDAALYAPSLLTGSLSGSPGSRGYIAQLEYVPFGKANSWARPWLNARIGLQYSGYLKFNGGASNYDGFGRAASQNNSLFLFYWLAF